MSTETYEWHTPDLVCDTPNTKHATFQNGKLTRIVVNGVPSRNGFAFTDIDTRAARAEIELHNGKLLAEGHGV
jgi:hypothetical protein